MKKSAMMFEKLDPRSSGLDARSVQWSFQNNLAEQATKFSSGFRNLNLVIAILNITQI